MRSLRKNQQKLYYATYNSKIPILDGYGFDTGEVKSGYNKPIEFSANISSGKGSSGESAFGKDIQFNRTLSSTDISLPIDEFSLIWYETEPKLLEDGTADPDSADYTVAAPAAKSLNSLLIALKKRKA